MIYDIQTNETSREFPFKLFFNDDVFAKNHCHTEVEFLRVTDGNMDAHVNGIHYNLNAGDMLMIVSGDLHSIQYSSHRRMVIQFKIDILEGQYNSDDISNIFDRMHTLQRVSRKWEQSACEKVSAILDDLEVAKNTLTGTEYRLRVCSRLSALVDICYSDISQSEKQTEKSLIMRNKKALLKIEKLFSYIHANYSRKITIGEIAAVLHYSPNYFTKVWKKYMGTSFHAYLNEYRVNKATVLLKNTDNSVTDIALETGFDSIKTFNRVFKNIMGANPSEFRKKG